MCPECGHNLCNNETLTGAALKYIVHEKEGDQWVETRDLVVSKQPVPEEGDPMVTWSYTLPDIIGKTFMVSFESGFKKGSEPLFGLEFTVEECPATCSGEWKQRSFSLELKRTRTVHSIQLDLR